MKKSISIILTILFLSMNPFSAFCQENNAPFFLNITKDAILFGGGILLSGSDLILDNVLEINRQEYDGRAYDKNDVNFIDRKLMHSYSEGRDKAADFLLAGTMLTPALLAATDRNQWFTCATMYAETLLIANGIKELAKLAVTRPRPYMYYEAEGWPKDDVDEGDWANSFPSGHSTMAFAGASFTSYTFASFFPDSKWKIPVTVLSYSMATGVAALRLSSGNHFLTDVLAGACIGSAAGILVPFLHTFNRNHDVGINLIPNGFSISMNTGSL